MKYEIYKHFLCRFVAVYQNMGDCSNAAFVASREREKFCLLQIAANDKIPSAHLYKTTNWQDTVWILINPDFCDTTEILIRRSSAHVAVSHQNGWPKRKRNICIEKKIPVPVCFALVKKCTTTNSIYCELRFAGKINWFRCVFNGAVGIK